MVYGVEGQEKKTRRDDRVDDLITSGVVVSDNVHTHAQDFHT